MHPVTQHKAVIVHPSILSKALTVHPVTLHKALKVHPSIVHKALTSASSDSTQGRYSAPFDSKQGAYSAPRPVTLHKALTVHLLTLHKALRSNPGDSTRNKFLGGAPRNEERVLHRSRAWRGGRVSSACRHVHHRGGTLDEGPERCACGKCMHPCTERQLRRGPINPSRPRGRHAHARAPGSPC